MLMLVLMPIKKVTYLIFDCIKIDSYILFNMIFFKFNVASI